MNFPLLGLNKKHPHFSPPPPSLPCRVNEYILQEVVNMPYHLYLYNFLVRVKGNKGIEFMPKTRIFPTRCCRPLIL